MKKFSPLRKYLAVSAALSICLAGLWGCDSSSTTDQPPAAGASNPGIVSLEQALSSGQPTLAEFGWRTCVPCKAMKPILEELAAEYQGRLKVVIVEVYEQPDIANQYQIMAIPTQVILDNSGREIMRHVGFWSKEEIIAQLREMGID